MIIRTDDVWTTVQCKNLKEDNGKLCDLCFKVLNNRFALTQQCPYCLQEINLRDCVEKQAAAVEDKPRPVFQEQGG